MELKSHKICFFVHSGIKLEINDRYQGKKNSKQFEIQQYNSKYSTVKEEVSKKIINDFKLNRNESAAYQIFEMSAKSYVE